MNKTSLIGLSPDALKAALIEAGVPEKAAPMRVRQLWNWIYAHGARDFASMTNLAKDFRALLSERFTLERLGTVTEQISTDGTRKWLLKGAGQEFETVFIPEPGRGTLCVSSQVGCTLNCRFCHTGTQKLVRNLTPEEIVGQVMVARDALGRLAEHGREPAPHQCRDDGHGRAALQFRQRQGRARDRGGWRRARALAGAASRFRPRASCR